MNIKYINFINSKQSGFSLLEILISLSLSVVLLLCLSRFYLSAKYTYDMTRSIIEITQNALLLNSLLEQEINKTAYYPHLYSKIEITNPNILRVSYYDHKANIIKKSEFFIKKTKRVNNKNKIITSLYVKTESGFSFELIPNIEKIKFKIFNHAIKINVLIAGENEISKAWEMIIATP